MVSVCVCVAQVAGRPAYRRSAGRRHQTTPAGARRRRCARAAPRRPPARRLLHQRVSTPLASTSSTSSTRLHTDTHAPTINHRRAISFPPLHPNSFPSPFLSSLLHFPHLLSFPFPFHSLLYLPSQSSPSIHLGIEGALHFYHSYICFFLFLNACGDEIRGVAL